eukprot:Pgem_evm2s8727
MIENKVYDTGDDSSKKFQKRWDGPMVVHKRLGEFTYELFNPKTNNYMVRNIDSNKEYHDRIYKANLHVDSSVLPFQGDTHDYDIIDANEIEVVKIIDHKKVEVGKDVPMDEFRVETTTGLRLWFKRKDLRCTDLLAEYEACLRHKQSNIERRPKRSKRKASEVITNIDLINVVYKKYLEESTYCVYL